MLSPQFAEKLAAAIADGAPYVKLPAAVFCRAVEQSGTKDAGLLRAAQIHAAGQVGEEVTIESQTVRHFLDPRAVVRDVVDDWNPTGQKTTKNDVGAFGATPQMLAAASGSGANADNE